MINSAIAGLPGRHYQHLAGLPRRSHRGNAAIALGTEALGRAKRALSFFAANHLRRHRDFAVTEAIGALGHHGVIADFERASHEPRHVA